MITQQSDGKFYQSHKDANGVWHEVEIKPHFEPYTFTLNNGSSYWRMDKDAQGNYKATKI